MFACFHSANIRTLESRLVSGFSDTEAIASAGNVSCRLLLTNNHRETPTYVSRRRRIE